MKSGAPVAAVNVAIAGGGMVGISLALLIARRMPHWQLMIIEPHPVNPGARPAYQPSFDDRATALSESSRQIFAGLGVWEPLYAHAEPIVDIRVSDRGHPGAARMSGAELGLEALGYVVENHWLGQVLATALQHSPNIALAAPATLENVRAVDSGMTFSVGGKAARAELLVVADGAGSATLAGLGIGTHVTDYGQLALVANISLARPHGGIAYERFSETGPLALLPLPDLNDEHRAALVWTLPPERAKTLLSLPEPEFIDELHQVFGYRAGSFRRCGERHGYPLQLRRAEEQVRRGLVVVGNAAHSLHPVAGQGFNLALRDLAQLVDVLAEGESKRRKPGDLSLLQRYLEIQVADQQRTTLFSDTLPRLFANRSTAVRLGRNLGLIALDLLPGLRNGFAGFGAGLATAAPTVAAKSRQ